MKTFIREILTLDRSSCLEDGPAWTNAVEAYEYVIARKQRPYTVKCIAKLHKILMFGLSDRFIEGKFRDGLLMGDYPKPSELATILKEVVDNQQKDPINNLKLFCWAYPFWSGSIRVAGFLWLWSGGEGSILDHFGGDIRNYAKEINNYGKIWRRK